MLVPKTLGPHRLAALGAVGACGGMVLLFAIVALLLRPFPRGGMDGTNYTLTLMAIAGVLTGLIGVHLYFAWQLWNAPNDAWPSPRAGTRSNAKRKARS
jgi:hypothetical protein